jgi:hypothetical protein
MLRELLFKQFAGHMLSWSAKSVCKAQSASAKHIRKASSAKLVRKC